MRKKKGKTYPRSQIQLRTPEFQRGSIHVVFLAGIVQTWRVVRGGVVYPSSRISEVVVRLVFVRESCRLKVFHQLEPDGPDKASLTENAVTEP
jgi:hypothetical protein